MKMAIQYGHGMKDLCKELLSRKYDLSIILSPRDLTDQQIVKFSRDFIALGGRTLIDPQLYAPHSNHRKLTSHIYWPESFATGMFTDVNSLRQIMKSLKNINIDAGTYKLILPGIYCSRVDRTWKAIQNNVFSVSNEFDGEKIATIVLSSDVTRDLSQIETLIEYIADIPYDGIYLLVEHPNGEYLVQDPVWLMNLMYLSASIKRLNKNLIVGYGNHQMLCLGLVNVDELASGNWMNVRSFSLSKFFESDDIKRKNTWYYCPQALTEYTPAFLDLAYQQKILPPFKQSDIYSSDYADILFAGALPSSTAFSEPLAFRHYLSCLYEQCRLVSNGSFGDRVKVLQQILSEAKNVLQFAHVHSISGQKRDFEDCLYVVQASVDTFIRNYGALLSRI